MSLHISSAVQHNTKSYNDKFQIDSWRRSLQHFSKEENSVTTPNTHGVLDSLPSRKKRIRYTR